MAGDISRSKGLAFHKLFSSFHTCASGVDAKLGIGARNYGPDLARPGKISLRPHLAAVSCCLQGSPTIPARRRPWSIGRIRLALAGRASHWRHRRCCHPSNIGHIFAAVLCNEIYLLQIFFLFEVGNFSEACIGQVLLCIVLYHQCIRYKHAQGYLTIATVRLSDCCYYFLSTWSWTSPASCIVILIMCIDIHYDSPTSGKLELSKTSSFHSL